MREELDTVLNTIGAAYLTANEWVEAAAIMGGQSTPKAQYQALYSVLSDRGGQGDYLDKLNAYYSDFGLKPADIKKQPFSNIFIGAVLG